VENAAPAIYINYIVSKQKQKPILDAQTISNSIFSSPKASKMEG
jgi:hypothetical protein